MIWPSFCNWCLLFSLEMTQLKWTCSQNNKFCILFRSHHIRALVCWVTDSVPAQAKRNYQCHFPQHLVFSRDVPFEQTFLGRCVLKMVSQMCKLPCTMCIWAFLSNHSAAELVNLMNASACWDQFSLGYKPSGGIQAEWNVWFKHILV